jgi:hypothetical protein
MVLFLEPVGCGGAVAGVHVVGEVPLAVLSGLRMLWRGAQHPCVFKMANVGPADPAVQLTTCLATQCWGLLFIGFCIQAHAVTPWRNPEGLSTPIALL